MNYEKYIGTISAYTKDKTEQISFLTLIKFLTENPNNFGWRGKTKPNINQQSGVELIAEKYFEAKNKIISPSSPKTKPDELVSLILNLHYKHNIDTLKRIQIEHQQSMAAENIVGELLERYIAKNLEKHGWIWCCGSIVKSIDFIKEEGKTFKLLQIKNRDNSENSSSSAIRDGTAILKWNRTFSKTGLTNWENFPDTIGKKILSEDGFKQFIVDYSKNFSKLNA